jgi:hypothetical protein
MAMTPAPNNRPQTANVVLNACNMVPSRSRAKDKSGKPGHYTAEFERKKNPTLLFLLGNFLRRQWICLANAELGAMMPGGN